METSNFQNPNNNMKHNQTTKTTGQCAHVYNILQKANSDFGSC